MHLHTGVTGGREQSAEAECCSCGEGPCTGEEPARWGGEGMWRSRGVWMVGDKPFSNQLKVRAKGEESKRTRLVHGNTVIPSPVVETAGHSRRAVVLTGGGDMDKLCGGIKGLTTWVKRLGLQQG